MENYQYDFIVFIGRFEPFHIGHEEVVRKALSLARHLIILVGSSNQPRTIKNPWTFEDRREMISRALADAKGEPLIDINRRPRYSIIPLRDFRPDNNVWAGNVQTAVNNEVERVLGWTDYPKKGAIIGHDKDSTSFYLSMFPQWKRVDHAMNEIVNATDIRKLYFESNIRYLTNVLPKSVFSYLCLFKATGFFVQLVEEWEFIKKYKQQFAGLLYEPTFVTVDAVVVQSGHILLVQRKAFPGKGLWALPGGFLNTKERIKDACLRELREETKIKVPLPVLAGSIRRHEVFDDPERSLRGRTITHAFFIELNETGELPQVKGSDDALKAKWIPFANIKEEELFEDHAQIIQTFLGQMN